MITKENYKSQYLKLVIAVVIGILIKVCVPVVYDLTPVGVTYLAVFIPTVFLWVTADTGWPSVLCIAMFCAARIMPTATVLSSTIGNPTVILVVTAAILVGRMTESGVMRYLAKWFISRKIVHNRPYVFFIMWNIFLLINTTVMGNIVGIVLSLPILRAVCEEIDCPKGSSFHKALVADTLWVSLASDACIVFFMPTALTGIGVMNGLGFSWTLIDYMKTASLPVFVLVTLISVCIVCFVIRPDVSNFHKYDDAKKREELKANPINKTGKICIALLLCDIFVGGFASALPLGAFSEWAGAVGVTGVILMIAAVLSIIMVDGKALHDVGPDGKLVPWKAVIFISVTFLFSSSFSSPDYGIISSLMKVLAPIASGLPLMVVVIIGAVICLVLTNVMSNVLTCFVGLSVFIPVLTAIGAPDSLAQAVGVLYICICSLANCTPSASPGCGLIMGIEVENRSIFKYSILFSVIMLVFYCLIILPIGNILYA